MESLKLRGMLRDDSELSPTTSKPTVSWLSEASDASDASEHNRPSDKRGSIRRSRTTIDTDASEHDRQSDRRGSIKRSLTTSHLLRRLSADDSGGLVAEEERDRLEALAKDFRQKEQKATPARSRSVSFLIPDSKDKHKKHQGSKKSVLEEVKEVVSSRRMSNRKFGDEDAASDDSESAGVDEAGGEPASPTSRVSSSNIGATMIAARFAKKLFVGRQQRRNDFMSRVKEWFPKFREDGVLLDKWLKKKGLYSDTIKTARGPALDCGRGRSRSAMARLVPAVAFGRKHREKKELYAAAAMGREKYRRRHSVLPQYTEEHIKEWQAIKEAVRATKDMRLTEQQKRVAEMLLEMNNEDKESDSEDAAQSRRQNYHYRHRRTSAKRLTDHSQKRLLDEIRLKQNHEEKERKRMSRKQTRDLNSSNVIDADMRESIGRRRRAASVSSTSGPKRHIIDKAKSAKWTLDDELFELLEEGHKDEEDIATASVRTGEQLKRISKRTVKEGATIMVKAKDRKLRHRAMLGEEEQKGWIHHSLQREQVLDYAKGVDSDMRRQPKWKRMAKKGTKTKGIRIDHHFNELEERAPSTSRKRVAKILHSRRRMQRQLKEDIKEGILHQQQPQADKVLMSSATSSRAASANPSRVASPIQEASSQKTSRAATPVKASRAASPANASGSESPKRQEDLAKLATITMSLPGISRRVSFGEGGEAPPRSRGPSKAPTLTPSVCASAQNLQFQ